MKTALAFLLSILMMVFVFSRFNFSEFQGYLSQIDYLIFALAVLFFIPQVALSAYRWQVMMKKRANLTFWTSIKLILAASAINILIPSRVGDLSKAYFGGRGGSFDMKRGMNVVLFEKYMDLFSLSVVTVTGVLCAPQWDKLNLAGLGFSASMFIIFPILYFLNLETYLRYSFFERHKFLMKIKNFLLDTHAYLDEIKNDKPQLIFIVLLSIVLWFLHLLQFYFMFLALHSQVSAFDVFRLVPLAILVGLIPLTLAGMGTRDSAMIYIFKPYESAALIAGVGLFASLRYFVPGILGLPFLNQYLVKKR